MNTQAQGEFLATLRAQQLAEPVMMSPARAAMLAPMLHAALDDLHAQLDPRAAHHLRILADDLEQIAGERASVPAQMVAYVTRLQRAERDPARAEWLHRLLGNLRKL